MITFPAGRAALLVALAALAGGCSREQQDWRAAEGADTGEAWQRFVEQHPESELAPQARARIAEIAEQRDWQHATSVATAQAYREFLGAHSHGKWSEEARIRIEAFSLGSAPRIGPPAMRSASAAQPPPGVRALQLATAAAPAPVAHGAEGETPAPVAVTPADALGAAPADATVLASATSVAAPAAPGGYGVQLGAFGSEANADREWQRLQERFGTELRGLSPRIVASSTNAGELYRLQAPAGGEAQARAICESLRQQAQPCVPVLPQ